MGSRDGVAAKIDADTKVKIEEMNRTLDSHKDKVIHELLSLVYDIKPEVHRNFIYSK